MITPRNDPEAVIDETTHARFTTAARALVLGAAWFAPAALKGLGNDYARIGILERPKSLERRDARIEAYQRSDDVLARNKMLDDVRGAEAEEPLIISASQARVARPQLVDLWKETISRKDPAVGIAWLRLLMSDGDSLLAAAAAAALIPPNSKLPEETNAARIAQRARSRLGKYRDSPDEAARSIAAAAIRDGTGGTNLPNFEPVQGEFPRAGLESLLIHGTWAYVKSDWWRKGGDFHTYVKANVCPNLYAGGRPFYWSGNYHCTHRVRAAQDLKDWASESGDHLDQVFAHSYGGVIAQMATTFGLRVNTLVFLSAPVEPMPTEWRNIDRAVSLRIHLDLALLANRRRQYFTENVEENYMDSWFWSHSDSHDPLKWKNDNWPSKLGL